MKKVAILACITSLLLSMSSCKKNNVENSNSVIGTWELRKIIGGFRGNQPETNHAPGNGTTCAFSDSAYQFSYSHVLIKSGNYSTGKDLSNATGKITDFFILSGDEKLYYEVKNDTLTLYKGELVYDGAIEKYKRVPQYSQQ